MGGGTSCRAVGRSYLGPIDEAPTSEVPEGRPVWTPFAQLRYRSCVSTVPATRMTASELLALISGFENTRPAPVPPPLLAGVVLAGIEVIATRWDGEPTLRRSWRDRQGGGAVPLLLLVDNPERGGSVYALGPLDSAGPLRSVDSASLSQVLQRIASLPRLDAVRELAAELDRLDQAGIPGLKLRQLLTTHTLDSRFRGNPSRWTAAQESVAQIVKGGDWRTVVGGQKTAPDHLRRRDRRS